MEKGAVSLSSWDKKSPLFETLTFLANENKKEPSQTDLFNVPKERVFLYAFFVLSGFIFSAIMLDQLYINQNKSLINKIVYYYSLITKKDYLKMEQTKKTNEEMGYVQLKSDE